MIDRRKKTERVIKIWILLANNPYGYTARELAKRFDVDERTIYRDFQSLATQINVPVWNDKVHWKIKENYFLPPIRFTIQEALNIFIAARLMLSFSHRYDPNVDSTFVKLSCALSRPLAEQLLKTLDWMQKLPKDNKYLKVLSTVAESWANQRQLKIVYRSLDAEKAMERVIDPYYIEPAAPGHASYVLGFCHLKQAMRMFKIERIELAELTADYYTIPSDFDANEYFGSSWGIVVEGEVNTVRLEIRDPKMKRLMSETIWHPSQTFEKQKDGSMIMTLNVTDTQELLSWILSWGDKVKVMEPEGLRQEIVKTAKAIKAVYKI